MKKILFIIPLLVLIARPCFALSEVKYYVNTGSTTGDCTTSDLSGAHAACDNLNDAIDLIQADHADLTSDDVYVTVEITGTNTTADTTAVDLRSIVTDATRYIDIYTTSAARHDGKRDTGAYRLDSAGFYNHNILIYDIDYVTITGIQIIDTAGYNGGIRIQANSTNNLIDKCIIETTDNDRSPINDESYSSQTNTVTNSVFISGGNNAGIIKAGDGTLNFYNNIVIATSGSENGIITSSGTATIKNCYSYSAGGSSYSGGTFTTSASDDGSESTTTVAYATDSGTYFTNVTAGSEDFHITTDSSLYDAGTSLAGTFTDDIDGDTRSTWDIGADEVASATGRTRRFF